MRKGGGEKERKWRKDNEGERHEEKRRRIETN